MKRREGSKPCSGFAVADNLYCAKVLLERKKHLYEDSSKKLKEDRYETRFKTKRKCASKYEKVC